MTRWILREAFRRLDDYELVLGPAQDGGYYLIGLKAPRPELFGGHIRWGTPGVLKNTLLTAKYLGLKSALLEKLKDVDRPEDLAGLSLAS